MTGWGCIWCGRDPALGRCGCKVYWGRAQRARLRKTDLEQIEALDTIHEQRGRPALSRPAEDHEDDQEYER